MTVSGLVVMLDSEVGKRVEALATFRQDQRITLGTESGAFVPLVTETHTTGEARELFRAIERTPGVRLVHVVAVDFSEEQ